MMKILIVDDDPNKTKQLFEFIKSEYPLIQIIEKRSYQSGLEAAIIETPDIILLDMTMPTFDVGGKETGGRERRYAGQQILRQLRRKKSNSRVIIVTQFEKFGEGAELITLDELRQNLTQEFDSRYLGTIFYQAANSKWRDDLRLILKKIILD